MGEGLKDRLRTQEDAYSGGLILYAWRRTETLTKATPHVHSGDGGLIRAAAAMLTSLQFSWESPTKGR